jgi:guanylate kinase
LGSSTSSRPPGSARVIVVTGPSGAGKGTLIRMLVERMPQLEVAVSATTRARREGEVDGREYWFLTEEEFEQRVQAGAFLEWVVYVSGHRYGTLASEIDRIAAEGRVCVLELETEGALAVKRTVPGAVTIFITASLAELERRLQMRATESAGEIDERLDLARHQLEQANEFDHIVLNDDRERAADELADLVRTAIRPSLHAAGTMLRP